MKSFRKHLFEAKLTHLVHIEDMLFDYGLAGGHEALKVLEEIGDTLAGSSRSAVNIQAKVDGAPAVIAGTNPENNKFFVATKSLFNKVPKINYTNADIDKNHGHAPDLAAKLKVALKQFPKLNMPDILQGDFMFIPSDLKQQNIDHNNYITFTPNTITYAVPENSRLAKKMQSAKVGVVWHTTYTGNTIADLSANFKINIGNLAKTSSVWYTDTTFRDVSGTASMTRQEFKDFRQELSLAHSELGLLDKTAMKILFGGTQITKDLNIYINSLVRNGKVYSGKQHAIASFFDFLRERYGKLKDKARSQKGKDKIQKQLEEIEKSLNAPNVAGTLAYALQWHDGIVNLKLMLVRKMERVNSIPAFVKTATGYKVTGPEGFVAIDTLKNKAVKLVDRMEFSQNNFNAIKSWG